MAYSKFLNGFLVTTGSSIDKRLILTKAEMLTIGTKNPVYLVPDLYVALCSDDQKFYIYSLQDKIGWSETTGHYHPIEDYLDLAGDETSKANLEAALKTSSTIAGINDLVIGTDPTSGATYSRIAKLEDTVSTLIMDGGTIEE